MKRLLIVDDNERVRRTLGRFIKAGLGKGFSIDDCVNGSEAVSYVASTPPDVVLMDVQMPVMGGIEATGRMRAGGYSGIIILQTGNDDVAAALRRDLIGANYSFCKADLFSGGLIGILSKYLCNP